MTSYKTYQKPPVDFKALKKVIRAHIIIFMMMLALGIGFMGAAAGMIYKTWNGSGWFMMLLFSAIFFCAGLFVAGLAFTTNISSIKFYYAKELSKRYGLNIEAVIVNKAYEDAVIDETVPDKKEDDASELELLIEFEFDFNGSHWCRADLLDNIKIYNALQPGQKIPIRILPWDPECAIIRQRKLANELKVSAKEVDESQLRTGEPLL